MAALRVFLQAYAHLNHRGYLYVWANVLWFLLSLPIITAPAAWAGLVNVSRQAYLHPTASLDDFWTGFRTNLRRGLLLGVLNVIVLLINYFNLSLYTNIQDPTILLIRAAWWLVLVLWFVPQFYLWPLLYELKEPSLRGAFRNALVMTVFNPLYTLVLMALVVVLVVVSTVLFPAWVLLTGSALVTLATGAVLERLAHAGLRKPIAQPEQERMEDDYGGVNIE